MARRNPLGKDPLDWIGVGPGLSDRSGERDGAADDGATDDFDRLGLELDLPTVARTSTTRTSDVPARADGAARHATDEAAEPHAVRRSSCMTMLPDDESANLERELLLMDIDEAHSPAKRSSRSNQTLLLLVFVFALVGIGLVFFQEARSRWDDQVATLQGTIESLESQRQTDSGSYRQILRSKDRVLAEKQALIDNLAALHRSGTEELRRAWEETRNLQEKYAGFFRIVFSAAATKAPSTKGDTIGEASRDIADDDIADRGTGEPPPEEPARTRPGEGTRSDLDGARSERVGADGDHARSGSDRDAPSAPGAGSART